MEIDFRTLEIRKIKADIPGINTNFFNTKLSKKIEKHFIIEYPEFTVSLALKQAFYVYIYRYILLAHNLPLKKVFTIIAQEAQLFKIPIIPGLN